MVPDMNLINVTSGFVKSVVKDVYTQNLLPISNQKKPFPFPSSKQGKTCRAPVFKRWKLFAPPL